MVKEQWGLQIQHLPESIFNIPPRLTMVLTGQSGAGQNRWPIVLTPLLALSTNVVDGNWGWKMELLLWMEGKRKVLGPVQCLWHSCAMPKTTENLIHFTFLSVWLHVIWTANVQLPRFSHTKLSSCTSLTWAGRAGNLYSSWSSACPSGQATQQLP